MMDERSLELARASVLGVIEQPGESCACPCCGQRVQTYQRRPTRSMCGFLRALMRLQSERADGAYTHRREVQHLSNDYSYLALFAPVGSAVDDAGWPIEGVIHALPGEAGKVRPGWWRVTPTGIAWMRGELEVVSAVGVYNGGVVWTSDETVSFVDALGEPFDLADVLGSAHSAARRA